MKKKSSKILRLAAVWIAGMLCLTGCSDLVENIGKLPFGETPVSSQTTESSEIAQPSSRPGKLEQIPPGYGKPGKIEPTYSPDDTWAVYWYLCGSDLETEYSAATYDLYELEETILPENVQVVVQTGGSYFWHHEMVNSYEIGRYLYDSGGLTQVDSQPADNMGAPETLENFLSFCQENYPADHTALVFWNHGGGSVSGVSFDETYFLDSLQLPEIREAVENVYDLSGIPPFELIGFDACLMSTIETAAMLSGTARYMVASQELEPGLGWNYSGWVQALGDDPGMSGEELGQAICDTYMESCEDYDIADDVTLAVVDLEKLPPLLEAYDDLGTEALTAACESPAFFAEFARMAGMSENYGGNTETDGYTNMVDLGHLVRNSARLLPDHSQEVLDALEDCVSYQVRGPYRQQATGLSCYYSYSGDLDNFYAYTAVSASESFQYLYDYELNGYPEEEGLQYTKELGFDELQEIVGAEEFNLEDYPIYADDEGYAVLSIGPDAVQMLTEVNFQLAYLDIEGDSILLLGRDNDIFADWENGVFRDNFRGVWGSIDGHLCYMDIQYADENYNMYSVPILLNEEEYNLRVIYDFIEEEYRILGARKTIDDNGMADKNLIQLKPGDRIAPLHYISSISGDDGAVQAPSSTFTVTEDTAFYESDMGDGDFILFYEMTDLNGNVYLSDSAHFTVEGDHIYIETEE